MTVNKLPLEVMYTDGTKSFFKEENKVFKGVIIEGKCFGAPVSLGDFLKKVDFTELISVSDMQIIRKHLKEYNQVINTFFPLKPVKINPLFRDFDKRAVWEDYKNYDCPPLMEIKKLES